MSPLFKCISIGISSRWNFSVKWELEGVYMRQKWDDDCCPQQQSRWLCDPSHTQTAAGSNTPANGKDSREPSVPAGEQNKIEGPVLNAARTDFGALSDVLGLHSRKVASSIAIATTRSRRRVLGDKEHCSHRLAAETPSSIKDAGIIRIMLVLVLDGTEEESFLAPEFRPLCSSLAGWHSWWILSFFALPHRLFAALLVISTTHNGQELNTDLYPSIT